MIIQSRPYWMWFNSVTNELLACMILSFDLSFSRSCNEGSSWRKEDGRRWRHCGGLEARTALSFGSEYKVCPPEELLNTISAHEAASDMVAYTMLCRRKIIIFALCRILYWVLCTTLCVVGVLFNGTPEFYAVCCFHNEPCRDTVSIDDVRHA